MADKDEPEEEVEETPGYLEAVIAFGMRCLGVVAKGSPPEPCETVRELLISLNIGNEELLQMYSVFHWLKQCEDEEELLTTVSEVESEMCLLLISDRRKYCVRLLRCIMKLGECEETVSWDKFLWVMLRFCSLNRVELAQALFLCILKLRDSNTYHFIRWQELHEFFSFYKRCPIQSFDTSDINFDLLPLRRYYVSDFAELLMRFSSLLNPMLHLQQSIQSELPGSDFWDNCTQSTTFCRKITFDFFLMETGRLHLRGEPPFRETCDMLAPDALGAVPINQDQWILRTWVAKRATGLAQLYVWGEQASPEVMEVQQYERQVLEEKLRAEAEQRRLVEEANQEMQADPRRLAAQQNQPNPLSPTSATSPTSPTSPTAPKDPYAQNPTSPTSPTSPNAQNAQNAQTGQTALTGSLLDPHPADLPGAPKDAWIPEAVPLDNQNSLDNVLSNEEAGELAWKVIQMDEEKRGPSDLLPPVWMRGATVAPALQLAGPDRPLYKPLKIHKSLLDQQRKSQERLVEARRKSKELDEQERLNSKREGSTKGTKDAGMGSQKGSNSASPMAASPTSANSPSPPHTQT
eukprot:TRINITY_DN6958_c0_g9_i1.p1 TRINITY_DN6958_c0_g9~~TRINITY_DN6958_c0_g9_i1.p1  ORF type:complete len:577 (+),score=97.24 TRINITY_DN6958_c0_g9_i1:145-1875(+)